jgi:hypothetical protein
VRERHLENQAADQDEVRGGIKTDRHNTENDCNKYAEMADGIRGDDCMKPRLDIATFIGRTALVSHPVDKEGDELVGSEL